MLSLKGYITKRLNQLFIFLVFLIILSFYFWTASSNDRPFYFFFEKNPQSYHQLIADGFFHGHLYLQVEPKKELLNLSDPYDPILNVAYRLHDASLYKNKYYFYFTPLIALLFLIPFKFITGLYLPDSLLLAVFCSGGFIFSSMTLRKLLSLGNLKINWFCKLCSLILLATATTVPFLMRRIEVYELCIGLGYFFMMMSLYYFLNCFDENTKSQSTKLLWTGFVMGLTFCARPNQLIAIGVLYIAFFLINFYYLKKDKSVVFKQMIIISLPAIAIGLLMMLYNYLRFDSIFEFGLHYQLAGENQNKISVMSFHNIMTGFLNYLFIQFKFAHLFPYFFISHEPFIKSSSYYNYEPVIGIFHLPVFYFLLLLIFIKKLWCQSSLYVWLMLSILSAGLVSFLMVSMTPGVSMRYLVDFTPSLLVVSIASFFGFYNYYFKDNGIFKNLSLIAFFISTLLTSMITIFTSFTGYYDFLKRDNPKLYYQVKNKSNSVAEFLVTSFFKFIPGRHFNYMLADGFDAPESWGGGWSIDDKPRIKIWVTPSLLEKDMFISFDLVPFSPNQINQVFDIYINHVFYKNVMFNHRDIVEIKIPANRLLDSNIDVDFDVKFPKKPSDYSESGDKRKLGIGFIGLKVDDQLRKNDV